MAIDKPADPIETSESFETGVEEVEDLAVIEDVDEELVLEVLRARFYAKRESTYIADSVVLVNPMYETHSETEWTKQIETYKGKETYQLPAHVYGVAQIALTDLLRFRRDTNILIVGETNSGKSYTLSRCLGYLNAVSETAARGRELMSLRSCVDALRPFVSAVTKGNETATRCVISHQLYYDFRSLLVGAAVNLCYFEKTRVSMTTEGESNYLVFYTLLLGSPDDVIHRLNLTRNWQNFSILKESQVPEVYDWADVYTETANALRAAGLDTDQCETVWRTVAAVLLLGNVEFIADSDMEATIDPDCVTTYMEPAAALLGVTPGQLSQTLCFHSQVAMGDAIDWGNSVEEAVKTTNNLIDSLFEGIVYWLIEVVNKIQEPTPPEVHHRHNVLGLLDFPGFQGNTTDSHNGFEQLVINYVNEKLHNVIVEQGIRRPQQRLIRDKLEWEMIPCTTNKLVCELIDQSYKGMLSVVDECCRDIGYVDDNMLMVTLNQKLSSYSQYKGTKDTNQFTISHFAGKVVYNVDGFISKNADSWSREFYNLANSSNIPSLKELLLERVPQRGQGHIYANMDEKGISDFLKDIDSSAGGIQKRGKRLSSSHEFPNTVSQRMRRSFNQVMNRIAFRKTHYIWCLRGNDTNKPGSFNWEAVSRQLGEHAVLNYIKYRQNSYCHTMSHAEFMQRYKCLSVYTWPNYYGKKIEEGLRIICHGKGVLGDCELGEGNIYVRSRQSLYILEESRLQLLPFILKFLQKMWRGAMARQRFRLMFYVYKIIKQFKTYKLRSYILAVSKLFRGVRDAPDFGKSIVWPPPPWALYKFSLKLQKIFYRWRMFALLQSVKQEDYHAIKLKILAVDSLKGKKEQLGLMRAWAGNYLALPREHLSSATFLSVSSRLLAQEEEGSRGVLFSGFIKKVNKQGKSTSRGLLITEKHIYKLDHKKDFKELKSHPTADIIGLSFTPGGDQLVVFHMEGGTDLVMCLYNGRMENRVAELAVILMEFRRAKGADLRITIEEEVRYVEKQKPHRVIVELANRSRPEFKKDGPDWILCWPKEYS